MPISADFKGLGNFIEVARVKKADRGFAPEGSGFYECTVPIVEELDKVMLTEKIHPRDGFVHPSSINDCTRKVGFYMLGFAEDDKRRGSWERAAATGTRLHRLILEEWLAQTPLAREVEYPITSVAHNIRGTADAVIEYKGELFILDLKTVDAERFADGAWGEKFPKYKAQLTVYGALLGIRKGIVLLFDRSKCSFLPVQFDIDPKEAETLLDRAKYITAGVLARSVLPAEDKGKYSCEAFCPFVRQCRLEEDTANEFPFSGRVTELLNAGVDPKDI